MNVNAGEISLAHIHAYVDAQLNDSDCALVEDYLDAHPEKLEELQQYLAINEHYQVMFDSVLNEATSARMPARLSNDNELFAPTFYGLRKFVERLSYVLFDKRLNIPSLLSTVSAGIRHIRTNIYLWLRLSHLEEKHWYIETTTKTSQICKFQREKILASLGKLFSALKIRPQSAPAWLVGFIRQLSLLKTRALNSYADVNIFAAMSIIVIGIVIGVYWHGSKEVSEVHRLTHDGIESLAMEAHLLHINDSNLVSYAAGESGDSLLAWISTTLGQKVWLMDLSNKGYKNVGIMLLPSVVNYAFASVYENYKMQKLTLYVGFSKENTAPNLVCKSTINAKSLCRWIKNRLQFIVVSDTAANETGQISKWIMNNYSTVHLISSGD